MATRRGQFCSNVRAVRVSRSHYNGDDCCKPVWQLQYNRMGVSCVIPLKCSGNTRPLGQDVIDAAEAGGIRVVDIEELLSVPIVEI